MREMDKAQGPLDYCHKGQPQREKTGSPLQALYCSWMSSGAHSALRRQASGLAVAAGFAAIIAAGEGFDDSVSEIDDLEAIWV